MERSFAQAAAFAQDDKTVGLVPPRCTTYILDRRSFQPCRQPTTTPTWQCSQTRRFSRSPWPTTTKTLPGKLSPSYSIAERPRSISAPGSFCGSSLVRERRGGRRPPRPAGPPRVGLPRGERPDPACDAGGGAAPRGAPVDRCSPRPLVRPTCNLAPAQASAAHRYRCPPCGRLWAARPRHARGDHRNDRPIRRSSCACSRLGHVWPSRPDRHRHPRDLRCTSGAPQ